MTTFPTKIVLLLAVVLLFPLNALSQNTSIADSAGKLIYRGSYDAAVTLLQAGLKDQNKSCELYRMLGEAYRGKLGFENAIASYLQAAAVEDCDTCHRDYDSIGVICLEKKDYKAALEYGQKALNRHSAAAPRALAGAHFLKGDDFATEQKYDEALEEYRKSLDALEDTLAYDRILQCYSDQEKKKDLLDLSAKLVGKFPDFYAPKTYLAEGYFNAGIVLAVRRDPEGAIRMFNGAMEINPAYTPELSIEIGNCYLAMKDTSEAFTYYSNALFDTAFSCDAALAISKIYRSRNRYELALRTVRNALNIFPSSPSCWSELSALCLITGKQTESIECDKISAKLGDEKAQERLTKDNIPRDAIEFKVLPWLTKDPFAQPWLGKAINEERLSPSEFVPVDRQPSPIKQVVPEYPDAAQRAGVEGTVWIKCLIDKQGKVKRAMVMRSDGEVFNEAALLAALRWRFAPAAIRGEPVQVWAAIPFRFKLNR